MADMEPKLDGRMCPNRKAESLPPGCFGIRSRDLDHAASFGCWRSTGRL
jgi:hypothetical protein